MRCKGKNKKGENCKAYSMSGSEYCYLHNPAISEEKKRAIQVKGGRANKHIQEPLGEIQLNNITDTKHLIINTIQSVRSGDLDANTARVIGYLTGYLLKAYELEDIENRLLQLESKLI